MADPWNLLFLLLLTPVVRARPDIYDPERIDATEVDIKLSLRMNKRRLDTIFKYTDVSKGRKKQNRTQPVQVTTTSSTPKPADEESQVEIEMHKTMPPVLGSICKHGDYEQIFDPYYEIPFTNYPLRLHVHKKIELLLEKQVDDAFAWSLCQYGGLRMQCNKHRRCECLHQNPPFVYVQKGSTCVGSRGAECTNNKKAPIRCDKGLNCTEGYCGGVDVAYTQIVAGASFSAFFPALMLVTGLGVLFYF